MNRRPAHEPSRQFRRPNRLWDDADRQTASLGCVTCLERERCGGLHTEAGFLDCHDLCSCTDRDACDMICRSRPDHFVARMREIKGPGFENAPRAPANGQVELPPTIPLIDHRYSRAEDLKVEVAAVSLYDLVDLGTGRLHVASRAEVAARFRIPETAKIVVSGVGKDAPIERWWALKTRAAILAGLKALGTGLVTTPNYSVLTDVPRTDNMYAMKRILLAWTEMAAAGLPAALHVNARTERDYERWGELIAKREEIEILAFEFATGCGRGERIDMHVEKLCALADRAGRPLSLVIRGGGRRFGALRRHFAQVSLIDTEAFARTMRRRRAQLTEAGLKWSSVRTPKDRPIDELLAHNVAAVRMAFETAHGAGSASQPRAAQRTDTNKPPSHARCASA